MAIEHRSTLSEDLVAHYEAIRTVAVNEGLAKAGLGRRACWSHKGCQRGCVAGGPVRRRCRQPRLRPARHRPARPGRRPCPDPGVRIRRAQDYRASACGKGDGRPLAS